ncbi:MAG: RNase A-like domain-containing protein [Terriglobales bacterium]
MTQLWDLRGSVLCAVVWSLALVSCQPPATTNQGAGGATSQPARHEEGLLEGPSRDLSQDEQAGGHILRKHVGQSEEDLRRRLRREEHITGASTYTDRTTAEHVVGAAIAQSQEQIRSWLAQDRHPNLVLEYDGTEAIGRTMNRGEVHSHPCTHALVVLKYAGANRYYVLTSYPECR